MLIDACKSIINNNIKNRVFEMTPLVDILLATYNGETYVKDLIASILNQTYRNFRLIIRDDGSTDGTSRILADAALLYPEKIELIDTCENLGCNGNFSKLLEHSKANYVMFSDQDDIWLPEKIEVTLMKMLESETKYGSIPLLVHTDLKVVDARLNLIHSSFWQYSKLFPKKASGINRLMMQNVVTGCTVMINGALARLAHPIPIDSVQHDWWIALVAAAFGKIEIVEKPLILYRQHTGNTLGARPCSAWAYLKTKLSTSSDGRMNYTARNFRQASLMLERYSHLLDKSTLKVVTAYCDLLKSSYPRRVYLVIKHKFYKNGIMRNLISVFPF